MPGCGRSSPRSATARARCAPRPSSRLRGGGPLPQNRARGGAMRHAILLAAASLLAGCAPLMPSGGPVEGKPVDEFVNDLKDELADVHWRIRTGQPACGTTAPREVDLRQGTIVLTLERVAQTTLGGDVRLVAF